MHISSHRREPANRELDDWIGKSVAHCIWRREQIVVSISRCQLAKKLTEVDVGHDTVFAHERLPRDDDAAEGLSNKGKSLPVGIRDEVSGVDRDEEDRVGREGDVEASLEKRFGSAQIASRDTKAQLNLTIALSKICSLEAAGQSPV